MSATPTIEGDWRRYCEEVLQVWPIDEALVLEAWTHPSYREEAGSGRDYQRLEFLGDAVLGAVMAGWLVHHFPDAPEGELSRRKARLVSRPCLAGIARSLGLGRWVRLGRGEGMTGGRDNARVLADAVEATLGAVYLCGGYDRAAQAVRSWWSDALAAELHVEDARDHKTELQEICQGRWQLTPTYRVVQASGPDHERVFTVIAQLKGVVVGSGRGSSRKRAEQVAALDAIERLAGLDRAPQHSLLDIPQDAS